jgi:hypothetical protein
MMIMMMYRVAIKCLSVIFSADDKKTSAGDKQFVLSTAASGNGANRKLYMVSLNTAVVKGRPGRYVFSAMNLLFSGI